MSSLPCLCVFWHATTSSCIFKIFLSTFWVTTSFSVLSHSRTVQLMTPANEAFFQTFILWFPGFLCAYTCNKIWEHTLLYVLITEQKIGCKSRSQVNVSNLWSGNETMYAHGTLQHVSNLWSGNETMYAHGTLQHVSKNRLITTCSFIFKVELSPKIHTLFSLLRFLLMIYWCLASVNCYWITHFMTKFCCPIVDIFETPTHRTCGLYCWYHVLCFLGALRATITRDIGVLTAGQLYNLTCTALHGMYVV